jgi:hypothetical protein
MCIYILPQLASIVEAVFSVEIQAEAKETVDILNTTDKRDC